MITTNFNAVDSHLQRGINLIEASAGTGKTYTIAMLVLRFIVEKEISIEQQLVVTFTKAATEELKLRVRTRLLDALNVVLNPEGDHDPNLVRWVAQLEIPRETIILRLRTALVDIDRAAIFTIHGLCQRLLSEFPLDGRQQFEQELMADTTTIMQNIMDDFWRREFYSRPKIEIAPLRWRYPTPELLYESVRGIDWRQKIYPEVTEPEALQSALDALTKVAITLQNRWKSDSAPLYSQISERLAEGQFMKSYSDLFEESWPQLAQFCNGSTLEIPKLSLLQMFSIETLGGDKGLKKKFRDQAPSLVFEPLDRYIIALERVQLQLRLRVLEWISNEYETRMERASLLSFDSLIVRMGELLGHSPENSSCITSPPASMQSSTYPHPKHTEHNDDSGERLKRVIQDKYRVALIDEFQDTDQTQWSIFSRLFGEQNHYFYLIGDPKQAIYKFRGADIFSYFAAQREANFSYTLENNWRSTPPLVESVNSLFSGRNSPFLFDELKYHPVVAAKDLDDGYIATNNIASPPMVLWQLPESEQKNGFWSIAKAESAIAQEVVSEILKLIQVQGAGGAGRHKSGAESSDSRIIENSKERTITPSEIAILVRTHQQAENFQTLLANVGIPSVHRGSANIFSSDEAKELLQLLRAVASPGEIEQLKSLLTISWSGLDGPALYEILESEQQLSLWFDHLHRFHIIWNKSGVMAMVGAFVNELLIQNIAKRINAERVLTNINHLSELLQRQVDEQSLTIHKTVAWLQSEIYDRSAGSEESIIEQQLRLESDDEALQIITMHSSKGLEFPVVFVPYLWQRSSSLEREENKISCHESGRLVTDIGSADFETRRARAIEEQLAEELRLLYVAVTRAKYRCYLTWADVRTTNSPNQSALSYLLFSSGDSDWLESVTELTFEQQQQRLSTLVKKFSDQFDYRELTMNPTLDERYYRPENPAELKARNFTRHFDRSWQMSSYSSLVRLSESRALHQLPEVPVDKAQEVTVSTTVASELPKGAHFGNVLHELLELQSFSDIAQGQVNGELRERLSQRYGLELDDPQHLDRLLQRVVTTPLASDDDSFTLASLAPSKVLKEMPFYLSMARINTAQINRLLEQDAAVNQLHEIDLAGYMTGFIDLIFEHKGRFYLLDYKSNFLESYTTPELTRAMYQHNYGLQYWIYSVVVHRYLKRRVNHYNYAEHFGGVLYLFVRGMEPQQPESGIYSTKPDEATLMALDIALGGDHEGDL